MLGAIGFTGEQDIWADTFAQAHHGILHLMMYPEGPFHVLASGPPISQLLELGAT